MCRSAPYAPRSMSPSPATLPDPHLRVEEPERAVVVADVARSSPRGGTGASWYGSPNMHDLHAAERLGAPAARLAQRAVDARP